MGPPSYKLVYKPLYIIPINYSYIYHKPLLSHLKWVFKYPVESGSGTPSLGRPDSRLVSRHWEIVEEGHEPERVDGDGV